MSSNFFAKMSVLWYNSVIMMEDLSAEPKKNYPGKRKLLLAGAAFFVAFLFFGFAFREDLMREKTMVVVPSGVESRLATENVPDEEKMEEILENDSSLDPSQIQEEAAEALEDEEQAGEEEEEAPENNPVDPNAKYIPELVAMGRPNISQKKDKLKIGFITDPHVTSNAHGHVRRIRSETRNNLDYFLFQMNSGFMPSFIVVDGDVIEGTKTSAETGMEELAQCQEIFAQTQIPKYWAVGNHDLRSVTKKQWKEALGIDYTNLAFEVGNYKIIILDSNFYYKKDYDIVPGRYFLQGKISQKGKDWLKKELESSDKKKVVFLHHPIFSEKRSPLSDSSEIREMLSSGGVLAVFSGHTEELLKISEGGVDYFTIPGMKKNVDYPGNFAEIEVDGKKVSVRIQFEDAKKGVYRTKSVK